MFNRVGAAMIDEIREKEQPFIAAALLALDFQIGQFVTTVWQGDWEACKEEIEDLRKVLDSLKSSINANAKKA